ncbi:MAG: two pore domain potassium channel family protein [Bacteroidales bacterium]|nr:two pore domain potassium channel family protein [Bacteroidales bacterium]
MIKISEKLVHQPLERVFLFLSCITYVFIIPLLPNAITYISSLVLLSIIFYLSALSIEIKRRQFLILATITMMAELISQMLNMTGLLIITRVTSNLFLAFIVYRLILQIANKKEVGLESILEVMSGYFLIGIVYLSIVMFIAQNIPGAYTNMNESIPFFSDYIYYTFITLTTVGYGDITPALPLTKTLSMAIAVSGQFYVAVVIAIIVGKYSHQQVKLQSKDKF